MLESTLLGYCLSDSGAAKGKVDMAKEQGQKGRQFHQWNPTVRGGDQSSGLIQASVACPILTGNHAGILHVFQRAGRNTDLPYNSSCHETDTRQFKGSRKTLKLKYSKSITQELPLSHSCNCWASGNSLRTCFGTSLSIDSQTFVR